MKKLEPKSILMLILFLVVSVTFVLRSFDLQIIKGSTFYQNSIKLVTYEKRNQPPRGLILDRNGSVLADNVKVYDLVFNYNGDEIDIEKINNSLIRNGLKKTSKKIIDKIRFAQDNKYQEYVIVKNLGNKNLTSFQKLVKEFPSILDIGERYERRYKYPEQFTHIIGYMGNVNEEDINTGIYSPDDSKGIYKLEKMYEEELRGVKDKFIKISGAERKIAGKPGSNLYLTLNKDWQIKAYDILKKYTSLLNAAGGAFVIMDSSNGEIVTQASYPGVDTNKISIGISEKEYKNILKRRDEPLLDKAIGQAYTPGSIFKLITGFALLENEIVDENTTYYSNRCIHFGKTEFCEFGKNFYGTMNIVRAYYLSSNLFFCNYLMQLASKDELEKYFSAARNLGIGQKTGIDLEGEVSGNMDSIDKKRGWFAGDTCNSAIGQGEILITPIQMANLVSLYINNGKVLAPSILKAKTNENGEKYFKNSPKMVKRVRANQSTFEIIKKGMGEVAYNYQSSVYQFLGRFPNNVIAKTGSSETVEFINGKLYDRVHGWVVGGFEHKGKKYSFALVLKYGGGGYYATPALAEFLEYLRN